MTVFLRCSSCGKEIRLPVRCVEAMPPVFKLRCPFCGHEDIYTTKDLYGDHCEDPVKKAIENLIEQLARNIITQTTKGS